MSGPESSLLALLKRIEWEGDFLNCPECKFRPHESGCKLDALIKSIEGQTLPQGADPGQPAAGLDLEDWTRIEIGLSVGLAEVPMGLKEPIRVAFKALRRLRPYFDEALKEPADGKNYLPCVRCGATLHVVLNADKPCPVCGKRLWKQTGIHIPSEAGDIHISYPDDVDVAVLAKVLHQTANSLPAMEDFRRQLGTKKESER